MILNKANPGKFLTSSPVFITSMVLGAIIGIYFKSLVPYLAPLGESYKSLLVMCILPIIFTSIVSGLANIFINANASHKLIKLALIFICSTLLTATLATGAVIVTKNALQLQSQAQNILAGTIQGTEEYPPPLVTKDSTKTSKLAYFLQEITPSNVFTAFSEGLTVKIILLALLIGIALGKTRNNSSNYFLGSLSAINEIFLKIFAWIIKLAPFGLLGIFAANGDYFNGAMLHALLKLILLMHLVGAVLIFIYYLIIRHKINLTFINMLRAFKKPLLLACATMNSIVAIPSSIEALNNLNLDKKLVELTFPLGITINRQGNVLLLAMVATFSAIFYHIPLTFSVITIIILLCALMGTFTYGGAMVFIPVFILIAKLAGIPTVMGITIIIVSELFLNWIEVLVTLLVNYAAVIIIAPQNYAKRFA